MENTMADYYKLLHFLKDFYVDREYPLTFNESDNTSLILDCELSDAYISSHEKSYKISNIKGNELITFIIPIRKYDTSDKFEINIATEQELSVDSIKVCLSESYSGMPYKKVLKNGRCFNEDGEKITTLEPQKIYTIEYLMKDTQIKLDKKQQSISNIRSISLVFAEDIDVIYLSDMTFRTNVYHRTLEDLDYHMTDGYNHVLTRSRQPEIPQALESLVWRASAAYSWLMWWENEGKPMDDGSNDGKNYATRLLSEVDNAIDLWLMDNDTALEDEINMKVVGYTEVNLP